MTLLRLEKEILKRTKAETDLKESQHRLDAMWLSVSEMEAEAVRLKTSQTREEAARLVYREAKLRMGFTDPDLEDLETVGSCSVWVSGLSSATQVSDLTAVFSEHGTVVNCNLLASHKNLTDTGYGHVTMANSKEAAACVKWLHQTELAGQNISVELSDAGAAKESFEEKTFLRKLKKNVEEGENKARDNSVEKNVVTELFDEVLQQKKNHPANPRQELTNILQDSIKDPALRNCLTSIIKPVEGGEEQYDILDREPQPGHDSEIDSYLGEDQPGEFDNFFG